MSKKEDNNQVTNDLQILKTILVSEPVIKLEGQIKALEEKVDEYYKSLDAKIETLRKDTEHKHNNMQKDFGNRMDGLESQIYVKIEALQKELSSFSAAEKNRIGAYLSQVGNSLMNE